MPNQIDLPKLPAADLLLDDPFDAFSEWARKQDDEAFAHLTDNSPTLCLAQKDA